MKKEIKAALLSALVCPGVGQIYLRRYLRGLAMILVVLGGVGFMVMTTTMRALEHLETIQRAGTADVAALANLAAASSAQSGSPYETLIWLAIACCWLISVLDAYRTGKAMGRETAGAGEGRR